MEFSARLRWCSIFFVKSTFIGLGWHSEANLSPVIIIHYVMCVARNKTHNIYKKYYTDKKAYTVTCMFTNDYLSGRATLIRITFIFSANFCDIRICVPTNWPPTDNQGRKILAWLGCGTETTSTRQVWQHNLTAITKLNQNEKNSPHCLKLDDKNELVLRELFYPQL